MNDAPSDNACLVTDGRTAPARLSIEGISTYYGEARALNNVTIRVHPKEVVAILGSNGAGKSTILKTLTGLLTPRSGSITLEGKRIDGKPPHEIIRTGVASVPEGRELFGTMTVIENLLLGTYSLPGRRRKELTSDRLAMVYHLFPILKERVGQRADTMSGGQQQMLAVARALMAMPTLLALDEPSLGLSPLLVAEMMKVLSQICKQWEVSLLLVEQNARAALKIADYVYVLERGEIVLEGACAQVIESPTIQAAYLGG